MCASSSLTVAGIPVFSDAHVIVQGYHPILLEGGRPTTPLSFDACDGENFIVVSGNNMVRGMVGGSLAALIYMHA